MYHSTCHKSKGSKANFGSWVTTFCLLNFSISCGMEHFLFVCLFEVLCFDFLGWVGLVGCLVGCYFCVLFVVLVVVVFWFWWCFFFNRWSGAGSTRCLLDKRFMLDLVPSSMLHDAESQNKVRIPWNWLGRLRPPNCASHGNDLSHRPCQSEDGKKSVFCLALI